MSWTEIAGFVTGALCVWLVVKRNIWNFPVGTANYIFFSVLFIGSGLYPDAGLQVVYFGHALYGWYSWLYGAEDLTALKMRNPALLRFLACLVAVGVIRAAIQFGLRRFTDSTVAGWDAITTALSLVAQFMLSRKWIANWGLWIAADLIYIPLYVSKGLWLTVGLYGIFLAMCVVRLREWRAVQRAMTHPSPSSAASLIARLPELGHVSCGAIANLAGLAPHACDSDQTHNQRRIWEARKEIGTSLYQADFIASGYDPALNAFSPRLQDAGKPLL